MRILIIMSFFLIASCSSIHQKQSCKIESSKSSNFMKQVGPFSKCEKGEFVQSISKNSKGEIEYACAKPKLICN